MLMQKSWSDATKEARAQRQADRMRTPAGYPFGRGQTAVMNLNAPGAFAAMQAGNAAAYAASQVPANATGVPSFQLSPPARAPISASTMYGRPATAAQFMSDLQAGAAANVAGHAPNISGGSVYVGPEKSYWGALPTNVYGSGGYSGNGNPYANTNAAPQTLQGSDIGCELGDFLTDIAQAIGGAAQAYGQVTTAQTTAALAKVGVQPVGFSATGVPIYQSTPSGVTPTYAGMVPSGLVLPAGVTPSYQYPVGFVQSVGPTGVVQVQPPTLQNAQSYLLPALAIGGGLLLLIAVMR